MPPAQVHGDAQPNFFNSDSKLGSGEIGEEKVPGGTKETLFCPSMARSIELVAAAKIIGRECAKYNASFLMCKSEKGEHPDECIKEGIRITNCVDNIIDQINKSFPAEFSALQECLDKNDHRMGDCRSAETQLRECWNAKMGYGSK